MTIESGSTGSPASGRSSATQVAAAGGDDEMTADLVQAVDELVCNVVEHGYAGRPGSIEVAFRRDP